jgi:hypothetical protein
MRKVRQILDNGEKLKGEHAALMRCVSKPRISNWRRSIEFMDAVQISELEHVRPSHAEEIARRAPTEEWAKWAEKCENQKWTVAELRAELRGNGNGNDPPPRTAKDYYKAIDQFLVAIRRAREMPAEQLGKVAPVITSKHDDIRDALAEFERALDGGVAS